MKLNWLNGEPKEGHWVAKRRSETLVLPVISGSRLRLSFPLKNVHSVSWNKQELAVIYKIKLDCLRLAGCLPMWCFMPGSGRDRLREYSECLFRLHMGCNKRDTHRHTSNAATMIPGNFTFMHVCQQTFWRRLSCPKPILPANPACAPILLRKRSQVPMKPPLLQHARQSPA